MYANPYEKWPFTSVEVGWLKHVVQFDVSISRHIARDRSIRGLAVGGRRGGQLTEVEALHAWLNGEVADVSSGITSEQTCSSPWLGASAPMYT